MNEAPREIWLDWRPGVAVTQGPLASPPRTHYIRADIAQADLDAAVRAAYEDAAKVAELAPFKREAMTCACSEGLGDYIAAAIRKRGE